MDITSFDDLLTAAKKQTTPQHFLLVFTKAELPEDSTDEQRADYVAGHGGFLVPVACVDKRAEDLSSFDQLCKEATEFVAEWDIIFAGALSAKPGGALSDDFIDEKIGTMVESIKMGQIEHYATFNRHGEGVSLQ